MGFGQAELTKINIPSSAKNHYICLLLAKTTKKINAFIYQKKAI